MHAGLFRYLREITLFGGAWIGDKLAHPTLSFGHHLMTDTPRSRTEELLLARCAHCGGHSFPPEVHGCRHCGAPAGSLESVPIPDSPRLPNFVSVHVELGSGLPVPCVIGEVQLAPGLVEEALIDVVAEDDLQAGMALRPRAVVTGNGVTWWFTPAGEAS